MNNTQYIRVGNVVVTLHYDRSQGSFKIGYSDGGKRVFQGAGRDRNEARKAAKKLAGEIAGGLPRLLPFSVPTSIVGTPAKPMKVEDVVKDLMSLKNRLTGIAKSGGGIVRERVTSLAFAGRLLILLFKKRLIHTITIAELKDKYVNLAAGKIDLTSAYHELAKNKSKPGQPINPVTVTTYFNRMNSFFVHARDLEALPPGDTACWRSLTGKAFRKKTQQKPYASAEIARLLILLERKASQMVRPVVFLLEGGRYCELAALEDVPSSTIFVYLRDEDVIFGRTVLRGSWASIDTGSIRVGEDLAKKGRLVGRERYISLSPFGARYFGKYAGHTPVIIPRRWRKRDGQWLQEPIDISRWLNRFIDNHARELGFKSRRNGFRHLNGSIRPMIEDAADAARSMGHSIKIGGDFYNHALPPSEAVELDAIKPLPGKPLPPSPEIGAESMRRDLAKRRPVRGGNVSLVDSGPLLTEFKDLYEEACGTAHGWKQRLAQLLDCSESNVVTWWASFEGAYETERAPSKVYVDKLQDLLSDRGTLLTRLNRRSQSLEETAIRIQKLEPHYRAARFDGTFELWLAKQLPPVNAQITLDWIRGRRPASKSYLMRLDILIIRLEQGPELKVA